MKQSKKYLSTVLKVKINLLLQAHRSLVYNKQKPKIMYSKNADFTNLDLFSCQDLDNYGSFSPDFNKPLLATGVPTFGNTSLYNHEQFFFQKSTQNLSASYQISFQKDFMKQHQAVFERELQNYMESFRIYSKKTNGLQHVQNQLLNKPQTNNTTCTEFISANRLSISHEQTQSFVKKFNSYDKLSEFLNYVVSCCPRKISLELIHVAKELLDKYQSVKNKKPSQKELLNYASEISLNPQFVELANLKVVCLNKSKEAKDLIEKSRYFMEVYCATTMLVIAQYFQNPYSSEDMGSFKRRLSPLCSEDQSVEVDEISNPAKKRKFSF